MSLTVILAAVWLIGIPLAVITIAAVLTELSEHRRARELDECLDRILSGGRTRSPRERRRRTQ
jgi:hypothetical protein